MTAFPETIDWIESPPHRLVRRRRQPPDAIARLLILHGYGDHSGRFTHLMDWLADRRIALEAFDFRGHGRSSGKRGFVARWPEFLADLRAVLAKTAGDLPLFVLGHSHGGLVAAAAGLQGVLKPAVVAGVILSAPYFRTAYPLNPIWSALAGTLQLFAPSLQVGNGLSPDMMTTDRAMIEDSKHDHLLLRSATPRWYCATLRAQRGVMEEAGRFILPLLCMIGDGDRIADAAAARQFVERAGTGDKTFVLLPGQRHEILRETDRVRTFERIHTWLVGRVAGHTGDHRGRTSALPSIRI